jgi:hypothetical protein
LLMMEVLTKARLLGAEARGKLASPYNQEG